jgi:subtilisin family serine protease
VIGVEPQANLYAVRVLDRRGWGNYGDVALGIEWAADHGIQIANMSLGGGASSAVEAACSYAQGKGVLLIAAAGNDGDGSTTTSEWSYPAAYSSVVSVGATNSNDGLASFSNTNAQVELSGPGVSVLSTYKKNGYATFSGTSMASPHAAGVAALIWAAGSTNASAVRDALKNSAQRDNGFGYGIVHFSN